MKYISLAIIFTVALLATNKELNWASWWAFKAGVATWATWLMLQILGDKTK